MDAWPEKTRLRQPARYAVSFLPMYTCKKLLMHRAGLEQDGHNTVAASELPSRRR